MQEKILQKAQELFMRHGVKRVTMDDIAHELGISKKTIYQFFNTKQDLVRVIVKKHTDGNECDILNILKSEANAIEEMLTVSRYVYQMLQKMNSTALYDLQKYYQESFALLREQNERFVYMTIKQNLERGIREGLYRSDLSADIAARFYTGLTQFILDDHLFPYNEFARNELAENIILYHLRATISAKGAAVLEAALQTHRR